MGTSVAHARRSQTRSCGAEAWGVDPIGDAGRIVLIVQFFSVLVVEDDRDISKAIVGLLQDEGHVAACVESAAAAIATLASATYDVILLDWMLREETAEDVLPTIAALPVVPPVILYSAAPEAFAVAKRWGIAFMKKPFDLDVLLTALAENVRRRTSLPSAPL